MRTVFGSSAVLPPMSGERKKSFVADSLGNYLSGQRKRYTVVAQGVLELQNVLSNLTAPSQPRQRRIDLMGFRTADVLKTIILCLKELRNKPQFVNYAARKPH